MILYDPPPRVMEIKEKINKWDLIKLKSFCTIKETISKVKRQPSEWEEIIVNEATDKELTSKIYKQHLQLNSRKINDPIKKHAKECSNYHTVALISHSRKVMLKILQARIQQYMNRELPDVQAGFRKDRGTRDLLIR